MWFNLDGVNLFWMEEIYFWWRKFIFDKLKKNLTKTFFFGLSKYILNGVNLFLMENIYFWCTLFLYLFFGGNGRPHSWESTWLILLRSLCSNSDIYHFLWLLMQDLIFTISSLLLICLYYTLPIQGWVFPQIYCW